MDGRIVAIVLRFSDFQVNTFEEHRRILDHRAVDQARGVWWAWWKKQHEDFPAASLRRLRRDLNGGSPVVIGLVNRAGVYLRAECDDMAMRNGGKIGSPDAAQTPPYYRHEAHPLWLHFIEVEEIDPQAWAECFGDVPVGDDTFFDNEAGEIDVQELDHVGMGRGLLHISDLHFGADFAFGNHAEFYLEHPLENRISAALPCKPAGVIVSGDLTTQGNNDGLVSARLFLERLANVLCLPRDRFVIAPGNHDILVNDPTVTRDFENEQHFRTQMYEFYGERSDLERIHRFRGEDGVWYVLAALNSSRPRDRATMEFGYVGRDRSGPVLQKAAEIRDSLEGPSFLGLVLHHHILPAQQIEYAAPGRPVSLAIDAGEIVGLASDLGFDAILHGHEHLPFVGKTSRIAEFGGYNRRHVGVDHPVFVLASGSTSVRVERLTDEMRFNTFSYYEVAQDRLRVQLYQFTRKIDPHVPPQWDFVLRRQ